MAAGDRLYQACCIVGLVLGTLILLGVLGVFITQGKLDVSGIGFAFLALVLMTLSFWQSVKVKVAGAELTLERAKYVAVETRKVVEQVTPIIKRMTEPNLLAPSERILVSPESQTQLRNSWSRVTSLIASIDIDIVSVLR